MTPRDCRCLGHGLRMRLERALLPLLAGLAMLAGLAGSGARADEGIAVGAGRFEMAEAAGARPDPLVVYTYRPAGWTPRDRVLIVMHGRGRDADRYRDQWQRQAEKGNLLLLVPEFSNAKFPGRSSYNFGGVVTSRDVPRPREAWVFPVIDRVFAEAKRRSGAQRTSYGLFGHSAGAQFVHRYLLLAEATNADFIVTANAGSYSMPTRAVAFPFGLGGVAVGDAELKAALARPVVVLLGDRDIDPQHPSLPRDAAAMAQGPHRLARGKAFHAAAKAEAERLGVPLAWRLVEVPGVEHDNDGMAARAVDLFIEAGR
jgi:dienelactone hydrolase